MAARRLAVVLVFTALVASMVPAHAAAPPAILDTGPLFYVDIGQRPNHYDCTSDYHFTSGPSSYPYTSLYGNGSCAYHRLLQPVAGGPKLTVAWNGSGTYVCDSSNPLSIVTGSCTLDLAVTVTETRPNGSSVVRNENWYFGPGNTPFQVAQLVTIYENGQLLGDGEGSLPNATSFVWREYSPNP